LGGGEIQKKKHNSPQSQGYDKQGVDNRTGASDPGTAIKITSKKKTKKNANSAQSQNCWDQNTRN